MRQHAGPLTARIVAALFGGYVLASLTSVAALALPLPTVDAVLTGMLISFAVHAVAAIWAFAARTAFRAWLGLLIATVPLLCAAWAVRHGAAA